jgi:phosphatidylinositol-bisphosphatase
LLQVPARFRFVPKLEDQVYCRPWLTIAPTAGTILPTEAVEIEFTLCISARVVRELALGFESLNDVLVLRLDRGQDFFVPITANPVPTAFGASIAELALRATPVRYLSSAAREDGVGATDARSASTSGDVALLPKEIWWLVDLLFSRCVPLFAGLSLCCLHCPRRLG